MFNISSSEWTWVSGSNTDDVFGAYGTKGVPSVNNFPGYLLIYAIRLLLVRNHVFPSETPARESGRDREETTWKRLENILDILGTL
jgi:hypothetical protein